MFGKKETTMTTVIGADSRVHGELHSKGTVRIDGILEGNIQADWVIVGESGSIQGEMTVRGTAVGGRVEGTIRASEMVEVTPKGRVHAEIFTAKLSIAEGGIFEGRSHMATARDPERSTVLPLIPTEK
jgi:cytoskeletal protein CcmA (bactofilin family)